ncbi:MAG: GNAT family acetyltransferase [Lachnospiraceae bacterium]|nr:GNAT family acetyltransferase [Lachnospiraceae bacterium]
MKLLVMCEGANEKAIMDILLENHQLSFAADDLLGLVTFHARQIRTSGVVKAELNMYPGKVKILRIGDTQTERLTIPSEYSDKIVSVEKYCTKPELEMLLIISEKLISEYDKVKSSVRPKLFAKQNIRCGRRRYDNSTEFYRDYYGSDYKQLVAAIREYKQHKGSHQKDEFYLADLLIR